jgi:predicted CXXCH cytochrome family protein
VHKFSDPRNVWMLKQVDALHCVACHREHRPDSVRAMDVTVPNDFCIACHGDIAKERPSHQGLDPKGCAAAGCHNYHDNKALYEDFLLAHLHEPDTKKPALVPLRNLSEQSVKAGKGIPLAEKDADAPATIHLAVSQRQAWAQTAHAKAGVNCSDCHQAKPANKPAGAWQSAVDHATCKTCHEREAKGFLSGKHGMRLKQSMMSMTPSQAILPMKAKAHDRILDCSSCHPAHGFDTQKAAVDSCLGCHDDKHSLMYKESPHYRLWQDESEGKAAQGSGVSCATCHLPRHGEQVDGRLQIHVEHNQNSNLRPNEKMLRGVCLSCHGLGFSFDALADAALVRRNFNGKPSVHVQSIEMAEQRLRAKLTRKTAQPGLRMEGR